MKKSSTIRNANYQKRKLALKTTRTVSPLLNYPLENNENNLLELLRLVQLHTYFQVGRMQVENRIRSDIINNNLTELQISSSGLKANLDQVYTFEKDSKTNITRKLRHFPVYNNYLLKIYGIGTLTASKLMAHIGEISKFDNISKLWQFAGYGKNRYCNYCKKPMFIKITYGKKTAKRLAATPICPTCGNVTDFISQKLTAGYMTNWNPKIRRICWNMGISMIRRKREKSGYRRLYEQFREEIEKQHPQIIKEKNISKYTKLHLFNMAMHKTIKVFLSNYWLVSRMFNNLSITKPYAVDILGQSSFYPFTDIP